MRWQKFWIIFSLSLILDRITKYWVTQNIDYFEVVKIFPSFNLTYVKNTGIAFSLGHNNNTFFVWSTLILIGILFVYAYKQKTNWPFALILSGALGNLYDRIAHQGVIDFLDFYVGTYHWPAFNIADSSVCIGAALLFCFEYKKSK